MKVNVGCNPLIIDESVIQTHHGSVRPGAAGSAVVWTKEHDCPELSHIDTVNLSVALVVGVHGRGVLIVG